MIADGFWNYLLFRRNRIDWAYWYLFPYAALVLFAVLVVLATDHLSGFLMAAYLAFLPYDFAWTRALVQLNPEYARC